MQLEAVKQHASDVHSLAGQVDQAANAAKQAGAIGTHAFGVVGQVIALGIEGWIGSAQLYVAGCGEAAHHMGDLVDGAHNIMKSVEDDVKSTMKDLTGFVDELKAGAKK